MRYQAWKDLGDNEQTVLRDCYNDLGEQDFESQIYRVTDDDDLEPLTAHDCLRLGLLK